MGVGTSTVALMIIPSNFLSASASLALPAADDGGAGLRHGGQAADRGPAVDAVPDAGCRQGPGLPGLCDGIMRALTIIVATPDAERLRGALVLAAAQAALGGAALHRFAAL